MAKLFLYIIYKKYDYVSMKKLTNYIKSDKSSLISLSEKLLINKDLKTVAINDDFYKEFHDVLDEKFENIAWWRHNNIEECTRLYVCKDLDKAWAAKLHEFYGNEPVVAVSSISHNAVFQLYEMIHDIFDKNEMEFDFTDSKKIRGDEMTIYAFTAGKLKVALWGYAFVDKKHFVTITFQEK